METAASPLHMSNNKRMYRKAIQVPDEQRRNLSTIISDAITLLCKESITYQTDLKIEGVIAVTLDSRETFAVHLNDVFDKTGACMTQPEMKRDGEVPDSFAELAMLHESTSSHKTNGSRRKRSLEEIDDTLVKFTEDLHEAHLNPQVLDGSPQKGRKNKKTPIKSTAPTKKLRTSANVVLSESAEPPTEVKRSSEKSEWSCPLCSIPAVSNMLALVRHMSKTHGIDRDQILCDITCETCNKAFPSENACRRHIETVHQGKYKFKCDICQQGFQSDDNYTAHMNKHKGIRRVHKCHLCPSAFSHEKSLLSHFRSVHSSDSP